MKALIGSIDDKLHSYQQQLTSLSQALDVLRGAAERIVAAIESDRAQLAELDLDADADPLAEPSLAAVIQSGVMLDTTVISPVAENPPGVIEAPVPAAALLAVATDEIEAASVETACEAHEAIEETVGAMATIEGDGAAIAIAEEVGQSHAQTAETPTTATSAADAHQTVEPACELHLHDATAAALAAISHAAATAATAPTATTADTTATTIAATADTAPTLAAAAASPDTNVVDLATRREVKQAATPLKRPALAVVASLLLVASTAAGVHELMQTDLGQRILDLGVCNGEMLSVNRNCALLAWLLL